MNFHAFSFTAALRAAGFAAPEEFEKGREISAF
jgi:hypothetical protein